MSGITVVAKLSGNAAAVRLAVDTADDFTSPVYSSAVATSNRVARLSVEGLAADTEYFCAVEVEGVINTETVGRFKTLPAAGAFSFTCAFAGDANTGSSHQVFEEILNHDPLFFIHLGDLHYENINVNDVGAFLAAYDAVLASPRQGELYRQVPTLYMWDDHDYGPNDSAGNATGRDAACEAYRLRVPHPPLAKAGTTDPIYFTHRVGRVLFIFTDQRSMATPKSESDNESKSVLGAEQKAWLKSILADPANSGLLFVWVCSRVWGGVPTAGIDHWGGYTTERREIADHMKAHCAGRFCVLSADMHSLAIDDGSNHDFATGGGAPTPIFQAAPLDRTGAQTWGNATYSEGGRHMGNGQFGVMEVADVGGQEITVTWTGFDAAGGQLVQYSFVADVGLPP